MDIPKLDTLLGQAPEIISRLSFYSGEIENELHPRFFQIIAAFQASALEYENNNEMEVIHTLLEEALLRRNNDNGPITGIFDQLDDAAVNLVSTGAGDMAATLNTLESLLQDVDSTYIAANGLENDFNEIKIQRLNFELGEPDKNPYDFFIYFDHELKRDGMIIEFIRDILKIYIDKLNAIRIKLVLLIRSSVEPPPPSDVSYVNSLLEQAESISSDAERVISGIEEAKDRLFDLGKLLLNNEIDISGDNELNEISRLLENLLTAAQDKSPTHDSRISALNAARVDFTPDPEDSELFNAATLANARREEAVGFHERSHLLKVAFVKFDKIVWQLEKLRPMANDAELAYYSDFRNVIDKYHLMAIFADTCYSAYSLTARDWADLIDLILNDQRKKVEQRNDNLPFALLPVRLETRFMTTKYVQDNIEYPTYSDVYRTDDDMVEIRSVRRSDAERATSTVKKGGVLTGVEAQLQIPDKHELWVRIYPDDIAIHKHEEDLTQKELNAAQKYWEENWKALGDVNLELGAWRALCSSSSPQRAAWIVSQTEPQSPPNPAKPTSATPQPHPIPVIPSLTPRLSTWSEAPHSRVMPERFVVRVYSNGIPREYVGKVVPNPLPVGFDPSNGYGAYLNQFGSEINMPPEIRWLTNFQEAEKVGMGIRVQLQGNETVDGFERLLVLGLKMGWDSTQSSTELETLLNNHHYTTGLSLVPQGTATNNTDDKKSGFASVQPGFEESFATELGAPLITTTTSHYGKQDGQRLAEALGVNTTTFEHVANSDKYDMQESMTMSRAVWASTLGYYVKNILTPSLALNYIPPTKSFFTNYVLGRGLIPAFRVKNQPYGVLTSTVFSKWKYKTQDQFTYESKLHSNILEKLRKYWLLNFTQNPLILKRVRKDDLDPSATMVDVLGLHPSSVEFHQRMSTGTVLTSNMYNYLQQAINSSAIFPVPSPNFMGMLNLLLNPQVALKNLYSGPSMQNFYINGVPRIFELSFSTKERLLTGPVIDSLPLSEVRTVENMQNCSANYLQWLATSPITYIRDENFINVKNASNLPTAVPKALLYLLLRQAWQLEYLDAAHCLLTEVGVISKDAWHNHELLNMTEDHSPDSATAEQKRMLQGFVTTEVEYENEIQIEGVMRNLATNPEYQDSGMTPKQYHVYLRDKSRPAVEQESSSRYEMRLNDYHVEQSQWGYLTGTFSALAEVAVHDHIRALLDSGNPCISSLKEVFDAFVKLQTLPTARLERCLAETLDTCAYRLDSWWNGIVTKRLHEQRAANSTGVHLGAYGILESVKPGAFPGIYVHNISTGTSWPSSVASLGAKRLLAMTSYAGYPVRDVGKFIVQPDASSQPSSFIYLGDDTHTKLIEDPFSGKIIPAQRENIENQGFILGPSLNHAVAAAVLRAGYAAHKKAGNATDAMKVGLSSDRVRTALFYLDGVRNGQGLGALLGYKFERGLHERRFGVSNLDIYINLIRDKHPLVSAVITNTSGAGSQSRHVTDGLKLLQAYAKTGTNDAWWPGVASISPAITAISTTSTNPPTYTTAGNAIVLEIERIKDDLDAIGDLLLSEAIFQVTYGNHTKAGSVLQALGYGGTVPDPEIINTPRRADTFTHRCAVRLNQAASGWSSITSVRAAAEPALNNWLASQLIPEADIIINYSYPTGGSGLHVNMQELDLQPIDLVYIFTSSTDTPTANSSELSRRVVQAARIKSAIIDDTIPITVSYRTRGSHFASYQRNIFEMTPILQSLGKIVANSRMLGPDDFLTPGQLNTMVNPAGGFISASLYTRLNAKHTLFKNTMEQLENVPGKQRYKVAAISYNGLTAPQTPPANSTTADTDMNALRSSLITATSFGIPSAYPESRKANLKETQTQLLAQADATFREMKKRFVDIDAKHTAAMNAPSSNPAEEKARIAMLDELGKLLFGRNFRVTATYNFHDLNEVQVAYGYTTLLANAGTLPVETWMTGMARVRPRMREYHKQMVLADAIRNEPSATVPFNYTTQKVMQFPVMDASGGTDRWLGSKLLPTDVIPKDAISMILETDASGFTTGAECGIVLDEWPEQIPINKLDTGIAVNYDQPNSDAPQSILLAVTPEQTGSWLWNDLMDTLNETIDMAKIRAVDPDIIHKSPLSQVLPMLLAQVSGDGTNDSPSLDFGRNMVVVPPGFNSGLAFIPPPPQQ